MCKASGAVLGSYPAFIGCALCAVSALLAAVKCVWSRVGSPSIRGSWPSFTRLVGVDSTCGSGGDRTRRAGSVLLLLVRQGLPWWPVSIRRGRAVQPFTASVGTVGAASHHSWGCGVVRVSVVNRRGQAPDALPNAPQWRSSAPRSCTGLFSYRCRTVAGLGVGSTWSVEVGSLTAGSVSSRYSVRHRFCPLLGVWANLRYCSDLDSKIVTVSCFCKLSDGELPLATRFRLHGKE